MPAIIPTKQIEIPALSETAVDIELSPGYCYQFMISDTTGATDPLTVSGVVTTTGGEFEVELVEVTQGAPAQYTDMLVGTKNIRITPGGATAAVTIRFQICKSVSDSMEGYV